MTFQIRSLFILFSFIIFLFGCASIPLKPGAQNVKIMTKLMTKHCKKMGNVTTQDISGITINYTSHANIQKMQINSLKNQAYDLGANTVLLTQHIYSEGSPIYIVSTGEFVNDSNEFSHQMSGIAYICHE